MIDVEAEVVSEGGLLVGCAADWRLCRHRSCSARVSYPTNRLADTVHTAAFLTPSERSAGVTMQICDHRSIDVVPFYTGLVETGIEH